ncbi:MAG: hypothetical protein ABIP77_08685 [Candidatus Limnocylindrales bacterium]
MGRISTLLGALAWLVAVLAIALGAAGLVTAVDAPRTVDRPEWTSRGDAVVRPALDAIEADLATLSADVDALGIQARGALASLVGSDMATVEDAIASGDGLLVEITLRVAMIRAALDAVPLIGTPAAGYQVSAAVRDRHDRLRAAVAEVDGLDGAWVRLTTGSVAASRLSALLAAHDQAVLDAAELGRDADYPAALTTLDGADAAIVDSRRLRDVLASTVDVTVLDQWLDRNAGYDIALRGLYQALDDVGGRVTKAVREAIDSEKAAKERLPGDSRGLILIMAEIGRGGMNGAVIAIEEARGRLADAIASPTP